jgi:hypothetical protein
MRDFLAAGGCLHPSLKRMLIQRMLIQRMLIQNHNSAFNYLLFLDEHFQNENIFARR